MSFPRRYRHTLTGRASAAGDESRARVLEVALELFAASGFRGTSVAQIAERAGLSQAGLLHHFPSKATLLTAALDYHDDREGSLLEIDGKPPLGWAAFDALTGLVARNAQRPHAVRLFVTLGAEALDPDHPAHEWIRNHYESLAAWLAAAVEFGRERGEMCPDTPVDQLVRLTIAAMDGLQLQWLVSDRKIDMVEEFRHYVEHQKNTWSRP